MAAFTGSDWRDRAEHFLLQYVLCRQRFVTDLRTGCKMGPGSLAGSRSEQSRNRYGGGKSSGCGHAWKLYDVVPASESGTGFRYFIDQRQAIPEYPIEAGYGGQREC